jgi:hypothetical protein
MTPFNQRRKIRSVYIQWSRQYSEDSAPDKKAITAKLKTLDLKTASANEVNEIIGNESWTMFFCLECNEYSDSGMEFDGGTSLCYSCVTAARSILKALREQRD